ncbi:hypothetical protein CBR_g51357 [Chara braunii]|uniref:Integrase catalytic domain-containing protein n=1 Tax=Chara braunii TaxID=69332 RepID=A0A388M8H3_CHABU|nr:hypothetical protein CBR_g51357 [Chara braunii]|eukprot:GBG90851.1 hypothetical protein CBR_g51357 [Chara braunii]
MTADGETVEDPILTPFDPFLVKLEEKAKLRKGLTWRAWNTITVLPYKVLNGRFSTTDIIADSLADIVRTHLLTSKTSLQDEATPIEVDTGREEEEMESEDEEEEGMVLGDKISPGGAGESKPFIVTTDTSQYGIGAVLAQQDGKKLRPIEYMSKKMPSKKLAKSTYERELYALYKALVHWRHFLLGRFFYLRTDHQTLKWIKTQPALSDALKRWIEIMDQYDFKLEYLKGEHNKVADALSRRADYLGALVSDFGVSEELTQSLVGAYQEDPLTMDIIRKLQAKDKATENEFVMLDGLLFLDKAGFKRLVVPSSERLRSLFLGECHDTTGHFGYKKTSVNLVQRFWWPGMLDDAKKYVETCQVCQRDKPRTQAPLGLLKPLPIPAGPGQSVSMDFMNTLVTRRSGKRHIFVIIDRFTKYARLIAMPETARTDHVIKLFMDNWLSGTLAAAIKIADSQLQQMDTRIAALEARPSQAVPGCTTDTVKQLGERIDHVVNLIGELGDFTSPATISSTVAAIKTDITKLQTRPDAATRTYKMPHFNINKFDDYNKTDALTWWQSFLTEASCRTVPAEDMMKALYLQLIGGAQTWMNHLAATKKRTIAKLHTHIPWKEFEQLWFTRFMVRNVVKAAMNEVYTSPQGSMPTRDWTIKW